MTCERFSLHGKRYDFDDMVIQPRQVQPGGPPLWIQAEYRGEFVSFELDDGLAEASPETASADHRRRRLPVRRSAGFALW